MYVGIIVALITISVMLVMCITVLVLHIIRFRKYIEKYNNVWKNFENENIEKNIEELVQKMEEALKTSQIAMNTSKSIEEKNKKCLQKIGLVKYDAYEKGNNGLSFALAVLNENEDGILINSIYTRNGSNLYGRYIENGNCQGNISEEEQEALQIAKKSKTFM